jgi:hypothetical protein
MTIRSQAVFLTKALEDDKTELAWSVYDSILSSLLHVGTLMRQGELDSARQMLDVKAYAEYDVKTKLDRLRDRLGLRSDTRYVTLRTPDDLCVPVPIAWYRAVLSGLDKIREALQTSGSCVVQALCDELEDNYLREVECDDD